MNKFTLTFAICVIISLISSFAQQDKIKKNGDILYFSNKVLIKLKEWPLVRGDGSVTVSENLQTFLSKFQAAKTGAVFPGKAAARTSELGKILIISFNRDIDPFYLSSKLKNFSEVEWAEPKLIYELDIDPNDPSYSSQWNLLKISAPQAWDVTTGDTSVIIGIVDSGIDWDHPDLNANIWTNRNEIPGNGIDDDVNGYIDDIRGWDFSGLDGNSPDNNPMEDEPTHGTHVAGIASAVTNNGTGIASIGFKCKLLPVKTSGGGSTSIIYGYEGIVYAADNGAKVINCSWGGSAYSIFAQEVIDYAASLGALIVAASGNSGTNSSHYPSGYNNVLSVASTNQNDTKAGTSTYGITVEVSAPGNGIFSTWQDNTYATASGTSMASPLAAGLAALVWSEFPSYTPLQIGEQIRINSDNIDALNPSYAQLLGKGRINAFNAVTNINSISARAIEIEFSDEAPGGNGDGVFLGGETISVGVKFINYLNPTNSLSVSLQSKNDYSTLVNGTFNAGAKIMLEEFDNFSSKFTFTLSQSLPSNTKLDFILNFSDGSYSDYQWISTIGNPTYATQAGNDVSLTITSKGTLGFNDYPDNVKGEGFHYLEESNLLFEGALILAVSSTQVSDAARGPQQQGSQNTDFIVLQPFILEIPGDIADQQGSAVFNDDGAGGNKIGITTKLESFSFADVPHNNYIILKYNFINNTSSSINNFYAGLFFDWDLIDGSGAGDVTSYDPLNNLSYIYNNTNGPETWVTTALLNSENYSFYAINNDGSDGSFDVYDGFSDSEKWLSLSGGFGRQEAGPGDISQVIGSGPFNINTGDTIDVGFVIGAAFNLTDLQTLVSNARLKYPSLILSADDPENSSPVVFDLLQNYPNPFNPTTSIEYRIADLGFVTLKIYDMLGREAATLVNENKAPGIYQVMFDAGLHNLSSGVYFYQVKVVPFDAKAGEFISTRKLVLLK